MAYQILNPEVRDKYYRPDQWSVVNGTAVLNEGVNPVAGTVRPVKTQSIQSLQLASGNPSAYSALSTEQSGAFGTAVMEMLKQYQGTEKYPFAEQGLNARQAQVQRVGQTPQNLIGASPELQSSVRGASVSAMQPTVSGAAEAGQTFASRLQTFEGILDEARNLQAQEENRTLQAKADATNIINTALANFGSEAFKNFDPNELAKLEKTAGLPKGYVFQAAQAIKAREDALLKQQAPQIMETSQGIMQWDANSGSWKPTGMRPYVAPSSSGGLSISDMVSLQKNPLTSMQLAGYSRQPAPNGGLGYYFYDSQGNPVTVDDVAGAIGASKTDLLVGSTNPADQQLIAQSSGTLNMKPLTDTATAKLSQFSDVKTQIDAIKKYATDAGMFDPVLGQFRNINPYDARAQQLSRMIIAVVPSLARGVFGEVGVLTDTDVERYTKLLPNVKTPASQVTEALNFLVGRVDSSYNNYIDTYKKAGYNVS